MKYVRDLHVVHIGNTYFKLVRNFERIPELFTVHISFSTFSLRTVSSFCKWTGKRPLNQRIYEDERYKVTVEYRNFYANR